MALYVRRDRLPYTTGLDHAQIYPSSKLLSHITGVTVQPNKAIVGANAFAHEAGIHQDGVLKEASTYEIMTPETVGIVRNRMVLGKHSGRHAFRSRLEELGVLLGKESLDRAFEAFKALSDRKKDIYDEDLLVLVKGEQEDIKEVCALESIVVASGTQATPKATVVLRIDGEPVSGEAEGIGAIDATFKAIVAICQFKGTLAHFKINAVSGGTDAQGEVVVGISENGKTSRGIASDTDIIVAAARAFIHALNRLSSYRKPEEGI